jgi:uncharacterized Zn-finger protein
MSSKPSCANERVEVTYDDLPLYCPMPGEEVWNAHPKVFLPIEETGQAKCPYCGTEYTLKDWNPNHVGH